MQMSNFLFPLEREASQALGLHGGLCKEEGQPGEMGCSLIMGQMDSCTMKHRMLHKPGWVPVVVGWGGPALPRLMGALPPTWGASGCWLGLPACVCSSGKVSGAC